MTQQRSSKECWKNSRQMEQKTVPMFPKPQEILVPSKGEMVKENR